MASGCIDCGFKGHPAALQFDHRDPCDKSFNLSQAKSKQWPLVLDEIRKCDVRCANCHSIRTVEERHHRSASHPDVQLGPRLLEVV